MDLCDGKQRTSLYSSMAEEEGNTMSFCYYFLFQFISYLLPNIRFISSFNDPFGLYTHSQKPYAHHLCPWQATLLVCPLIFDLPFGILTIFSLSYVLPRIMFLLTHLKMQGENLVTAVLTGPGIVFIQSLPFHRLSQRIAR